MVSRRSFITCETNADDDTLDPVLIRDQLLSMLLAARDTVSSD